MPRRNFSNLYLPHILDKPLHLLLIALPATSSSFSLSPHQSHSYFSEILDTVCNQDRNGLPGNKNKLKLSREFIHLKYLPDTLGSLFCCTQDMEMHLRCHRIRTIHCNLSFYNGMNLLFDFRPNERTSVVVSRKLSCSRWP